MRELRPEAADFFKDTYFVEFLSHPATHLEADLHRGLIENVSTPGPGFVLSPSSTIGHRGAGPAPQTASTVRGHGRQRQGGKPQREMGSASCWLALRPGCMAVTLEPGTANDVFCVIAQDPRLAP